MTSVKRAKDSNRLAPEDAYLRRHASAEVLALSGRHNPLPRGGISPQRASKSRGKRQKAPWKKLLWVKQSYPDNYTDEETFLNTLQRNPRLIPYEFWPLVGDSTVIVQQVCTVILFVCSFAGIVQERISPVTVARWSTGGTVLGWLLWDFWIGNSAQSANSELKVPPDTGQEQLQTAAQTPDVSHPKPQSRTQQRLETAKSAILIYCTLLGLSPILKSLTKSTSSDSIWAISFWLLCINVVFFDYGGSVGATFPASLSTNAALMASTVLASRLSSTMHVFSLTLFSIQVFGLFPIFRRYLRHASRVGHFALTGILVASAGGGAAVAISGGGIIAWALGMVIGCMVAGLAMGLCSWWLIGLQQYKNEMRGPWDPAKPIIRHWD